VLLASRGRLRVTRGEHERGLADLLEADHRMSAAGMRLSVLCDWTSSAAQALSSTGRSRHARELAERELAAATDYGAARGRGIALSLLGQLDGGEEGLASLREAVDVLEGSPARLEHGRALLGLGIGLRTRGASELAREPLSRALDIAHGCGAVRLAEHAREVLVATGARPRRSALTGTDALTPAQLRAATMAAEGMTNGQIAEALYVVKKTVEAHLRTVYSKLQISGRAQLRDALEPAAAEPRAATIRG
jgi:DNA-binding CsgD family transcriptional regulator